MRSWKKIFVVIATVSIVAFLFGCAPKVAPATEAPATEAPATEAATTESAAPDFSGVKLTANIETGPHGQTFKKIAEGWMKETGATITWTELPGWPEMFQKTLLEVQAGGGETDLMQVSSVWLPQIGQYLEPLGSYIDAYKIDTTQLIPKVAVDSATIDGQLIGLTLAAESFPYAYRTDFFEKYGVTKVPETLDEMLEAAKLCNHPEDNVYGFAGMAKRGVYPYWHYITFLRAMGGDVFDAEGNPILDSDVALKAMEYTKELYSYTDPACLAWSHFESYDSFYKTGNVAQIILWDGGFKAWLFNKEASQFVDVSGATKCPGVKTDGEIKYGQPIQMWYMAINSKSKNKDAAFDVMNYVCYKNAIEYTKGSTFITTTMAKDDPEVQAMSPIWDAVLGAMEDASTEPGGAHYMEMADIIGTETSAIIAGEKSPADGLKSANDKLKELVGK